MTTRVRRLARRIGRRGASLLFVGLLSCVLSVGLWVVNPAQAASPGYVVLADLAPLKVWSAAWGVSTVLCWMQAFARQDRLAFAIATAMWWLYGIAYLVGVATAVNPRGWFLGAVWVLFGAWVNLIATWPEAADLPAGDEP